MKRAFGSVIVMSVCLPALAPQAFGQGHALNPQVIQTGIPARLVELTAHLTVTNQTATPVRRYVFRLTTPVEEAASQRTALLSSDIPPTTVKTHKTGANHYLEFHLPVGPNATVQNAVKFLVLVVPVDYMQTKMLGKARTGGIPSFEPYIKPSRHVEADCPEVRAAAKQVFRSTQTANEKALAAYRYPSQVLKFRLQNTVLGAQKALQMGTGDCTEHACVFVALCRTQGIPARRVGVFNLGPNNEIAKPQPNHDIAEVYLRTHGWIPVDANLGHGRDDRPIGFGKLSNTCIIMNREGSWGWSTSLPPDSYSRAATKPQMKPSISWKAKVLKEGKVQELIREFARLKRSRLKRR